MKKTFEKQATRLPRISVEALESRTLLSAGAGPGHGHHAEHAPGLVLRAIATNMQATPSDGALPTDGLAVFQISTDGSSAWQFDGRGHATLSGKVIQIGQDGTTTFNDVNVTLADITSTKDDSKDKTDDGSTDCPTDPKTTNPGTPTTPTTPGKGTANPNISRPNGAGTSGPQTNPTPTTPGPTPLDSPRAQPTIARPSSPPVDPTTPPVNAGATLTPLAMTPASPGFTPAPINVVPNVSVSNVPTMAGASAAPSYSATNASTNLPAVHELSHSAEHVFGTLAAITPPITLMVSLPVDAIAAPVQVATGAVHVSDVAGNETTPGTYLLASAAPSLPARIAYNFVRLDAAAFHDAAGAFAVELAALNVSNNTQSHTRAWAITAGVLTVDIALLVYWYRQAKRRKLLLKTETPI